MKAVAFIPIKLNSVRVQDKNIRPFFGGISLTAWSLQHIVGTQGLDDIYVYCSSEAIQKHLPPGVTFLKRPPHLDADDASINDLIQSFGAQVPADVYLMTHVTSPFLNRQLFEKALAAVAGGQHDSAIAVEPLREFLRDEKKALNYDVYSIPRTQDLPLIYRETSGFYVFTRALLKQGRRVGDNPALIECGKMEAMDIDYPQDFLMAQAVQNYLNSHPSTSEV